MAFVFRFEYETPQQSAGNARHGWDDESSQFVVIDAATEAARVSVGAVGRKPVAIGQFPDFADWV